MSEGSRERMVRSAASLISFRGLSATSFSDVLADSGAPRGSIYHHFPDGKAQLATDAVQWTSDRVVAHLRAGRETTPAAVLDRFFTMWRQVVLASGGAAGCVVAGVAVDSTAGPGALLETARQAFQAWTGVLADRLIATGVPDQRASAIATAVLAGMEGALILCRADGGVGPLDTVAAQLVRLVTD